MKGIDKIYMVKSLSNLFKIIFFSKESEAVKFSKKFARENRVKNSKCDYTNLPYEICYQDSKDSYDYIFIREISDYSIIAIKFNKEYIKNLNLK